jgi:hypothetical protein
MPDQKIKVDLKDVENLGAEFREVAEVGLRRTVERGERLLREEVPKVTHNLEQGVSSDVDASALRGDLIVSARSGRVGVEGGLLHLANGQTREVTLRARPAYDYARAVAKGTGVYSIDHEIGPTPVIRPTSAKALLVPVDTVPTLNGKTLSYIESNGQKYIVRKYIKGRKPDPYDERAANRLESEVDAIFDRVVQAFANQEVEH